jgi:fibronectin type 3 domain-containing protein
MPTTNTLTWNKNTELDVAKYNVYRKVGSAPTRTPSDVLTSVVATSLATQTYVDTVTIDGEYFYGVTAVDLSNNESPLSAIKSKLVDSVPPVAPTGLVVV